MSAPIPLRIGFLASHGGSNMQAILDAIASGALPAQACVTICNNSGARALQRAQDTGVPALHLSATALGSEEALDRAMLEALQAHRANLVVCAGYMRKVGPKVLSAYTRRILNVHPALLPRFGGQGMYGIHVHEAVLAAGERETGVTVHLVDEVYDHGPIVAQARVAVQPGDTPQTLQARVLEAEHRLYSDTLARIASGEIDLDQL